MRACCGAFELAGIGIYLCCANTLVLLWVGDISMKVRCFCARAAAAAISRQQQSPGGDDDPEALAMLLQAILDFKQRSISNPPTNTSTSKGDALRQQTVWTYSPICRDQVGNASIWMCRATT